MFCQTLQCIIFARGLSVVTSKLTNPCYTPYKNPPYTLQTLKDFDKNLYFVYVVLVHFFKTSPIMISSLTNKWWEGGAHLWKFEPIRSHGLRKQCDPVCFWTTSGSSWKWTSSTFYIWLHLCPALSPCDETDEKLIWTNIQNFLWDDYPSLYIYFFFMIYLF